MRKLLVFVLMLLSVSACVPAQRQLSVSEELARKAKVDRLYLKSRKLFREGTESALESAEAALELARDLLGDQARIFDALGCIEWARGKKIRSEEFFKKAIAVDPEFSESYGNLAFIALENGDLIEAEALFKIALSLKPSNYRARNNMAVYLSELGRLDKSRAELLKSLHTAGYDRGPIENNLEFVDSLKSP